MRNLALLVVVVLACTPGARDWHTDVAAWKPSLPVPSFPLVDQSGRAFHLDELRGEPLAVGFVFTHCAVADACPMTMARLVQLEDALKNDPNAATRDVRVLVVTIDPLRDTPPVLAAYGARFGVDPHTFTLATGDKDVVDALASLFDVAAVRDGDTITHPVKVALLDKNLVIKRAWKDNNFVPKEIVDAAAAQ